MVVKLEVVGCPKGVVAWLQTQTCPKTVNLDYLCKVTLWIYTAAYPSIFLSFFSFSPFFSSLSLSTYLQIHLALLSISSFVRICRLHNAIWCVLIINHSILHAHADLCRLLWHFEFSSWAFYFCCIWTSGVEDAMVEVSINSLTVSWWRGWKLWRLLSIILDHLVLLRVSSIRRCERIFGRVPGVPHILSYPKSCCDWQNCCKYHLFFRPCGACVHHPNTCSSMVFGGHCFRSTSLILWTWTCDMRNFLQGNLGG